MRNFSMKSRSCPVALVAMLVFQMIAAPVFAQNWQSRNLPMSGNEKSSSFRPDKAPDMGGGNEGSSIPSGMMGGVGGMMGSDMQMLQYQVHVVGEVSKPGTYRVTASERVSEVLKKAGGIVDEGSKRHIQIKRKEGSTSNVDLLSFELYGDLKNNPFVMDNDVIFVPLRKGAVQVVGAVKRPLVYELAGEKNVKDVINLAGGYNAGFAPDQPLRVIRFENSEKKVHEIPNDPVEMARFNIMSGDVVVVSSVVTAKHKFDYNVAAIPGDKVFYPSYEDRVFVLGGVNKPGAYDWNPYYTIQQYITMAGGVSPLAKGKVNVVSAEGKKRSVKMGKTAQEQVNPGDTVMVNQRRLAPESWVSLFLAVAGFGLSATATVVTLNK